MTNLEFSPLLTDLYQLTMLQAYLDEGMQETAVFEFFIRKMPMNRNFFMVAGIESVLDYLENLSFSEEDIAYLRQDGRFNARFLNYLENFKFTGDVNGMPEATLVFPDEPILQIIAPLPQAQLIESRLINLMQYQTMIASKAARCVLAAPGKLLVDFGMRRAHGAEAALLASRANYIGGFAGTATVLAGQRYHIPTFGTMAHAYVQAHEDEKDAFIKFAKSHPENVVLLIDTYDTERAAQKVAEITRQLRQDQIQIKAVRIDSGNLGEHAIKVRKILDEAHCHDIKIFTSGDLDEYKLQELVKNRYPIDGFGVGTKLNTSQDAPYLDCAYKLQVYAGKAKRKKSEGKTTWPGQKQVYRYYKDERLHYDVVTLHDDATQAGEVLLKPLLRGGRRLSVKRTLPEIKMFAQENLAQLPESLAQIEKADHEYPVRISQALQELTKGC